jgi:hypothetical protein
MSMSIAWTWLKIYNDWIVVKEKSQLKNRKNAAVLSMVNGLIIRGFISGSSPLQFLKVYLIKTHSK